jgi:hypothetical protein
MKVCTKCVMPETAESLDFSEPVCSVCKQAETKRDSDWNERQRVLRGLTREIAALGRDYDAIIPFSGGKDDFDVYGNPSIDAGVRAALVDAIVARVAERAVDGELSEVLATGYAVVGDDAWAAVLLDRGFRVNRRFSRLRIELDGPRPFPAAPAVTVRPDPACEQDWSDWHRILVDSFSEHWGSTEMTLTAFRGRIDAEQD